MAGPAPRIVVGFHAGGSSDVVARLLAERLRPALDGATLIVENKPGASGAVAIRRLDEFGFAAHPTTPAAFTEWVRTEEARWRKLIEERGLKLD